MKRKSFNFIQIMTLLTISVLVSNAAHATREESYAKSLEIDRVNRQIDQLAEKRGILSRIWNLFFKPKSFDLNQIPSVALQADGSIKKISARENYLTRLEIEAAAGARLITLHRSIEVVLDDQDQPVLDERNQPLTQITPVFAFEHPLSPQKALKAILVLQSKIIKHYQQVHKPYFFQSLYKDLLSQALGQFLSLPEVTAQEARNLQLALDARIALTGGQEHTSIEGDPQAASESVVLPAFKAAEAKNFIGLYKAVMGEYPDLTGCWNSGQGRDFTPQDMENQYRKWDQNPDLPLVCTTAAQDQLFAARLSQLTGRKLTIMTDAQNEYSIRGRELDAEGKPLGKITTSIYHFGDDANQLKEHGFFDNNPHTQNRSHGVHEIPSGANPDDYKNSFGLIHPIGNVHSRSAEGVLRGGSFFDRGRFAKSSNSNEGCENDRYGSISSRLAEL